MADFDPDAYLAKPPPDFDPDAYLSTPPAEQSTLQKVGSIAKEALGPAESVGRLAYGAVAAPVSGLAGIAQGAYNTAAEALGAQPGMPAAERVEQIQGALGAPKTKLAQFNEQMLGATLGRAQQAVRKPGEMIADAGYPKTGAVVSAVPETALALLAPESRGAVSSGVRALTGSAGKAATAAASGVRQASFAGIQRAKEYVSSRTGLNWADLPAEMQTRLANIAEDAKALAGLDPKAIERQAQLARVGIKTATRGQLTRDPLQLRREQLAKASDAGEELRQLDLDNNRILAQNIESLRGGAKARGEVQTGKSVQDALRERYSQGLKRVKRLYKTAEKAGELQGPVNIDALVDYVANHDDPAQVAYIRQRLNALGATVEEETGGLKVSQNRPLTLKELEGIRRSAVARGKAGGTEGHYASEVKQVIDSLTEGAGGEAYQAARKARAAVGEEFERTQAVAALVKNRKMSMDRATALEDTWHKSVISGGLEDLTKVRDSLTKSPKGRQAWDDLRGATADYILEKATTGPKNQLGEVNTSWGGLRRAVSDIGQEKLELLFGKAGAKKLNDLVEAAEILKTEPPTGVKGSPTMDKLITLLDKFGAVPIVGHGAGLAVGAAKSVQKLAQIGESAREAARAKVSPLEEAEAKVTAPARRRQTLESLARKTGKAVSREPLTIGDRQDQQ